jgi:hypothetical protein
VQSDHSNRKSYSPDVAFDTGQPIGMRFLEGALIFAVAGKSEGDYSPAVEKATADERADYFAAGTRVVWDVDLLRPYAVRACRANDPGSSNGLSSWRNRRGSTCPTRLANAG